MLKRKRIREKGKPRLSKVFKEFKPNEKVIFIRKLGEKDVEPFPKQFHGKTGIVESKIGRAYIVKFLNGKVHKKLVVKPIYLKKV